MTFEDALDEHGRAVDGLLAQAKRYEAGLKRWRKACDLGDVTAIQRSAEDAAAQARSLSGPAERIRDSWDFPLREYLDGDQWREELVGMASARLGLRILTGENGTLLSSPVVVRALPETGRLRIGKQLWPALRPSKVTAHLKALRERGEATSARELLEALYRLWTRRKQGEQQLGLSDAYQQFSLAPGWRRDNPRGVCVRIRGGLGFRRSQGCPIL